MLKTPTLWIGTLVCFKYIMVRTIYSMLHLIIRITSRERYPIVLGGTIRQLVIIQGGHFVLLHFDVSSASA